MSELATMRSQLRKQTAPASYVKLVGVTDGAQALWAYEQAAHWLRQHDPRAGQYSAVVRGDWRLTLRRSQTGVTAKFEEQAHD